MRSRLQVLDEAADSRCLAFRAADGSDRSARLDRGTTGPDQFSVLSLLPFGAETEFIMIPAIYLFVGRASYLRWERCVADCRSQVYELIRPFSQFHRSVHYEWPPAVRTRHRETEAGRQSLYRSP